MKMIVAFSLWLSLMGAAQELVPPAQLGSTAPGVRYVVGLVNIIEPARTQRLGQVLGNQPAAVAPLLLNELFAEGILTLETVAAVRSALDSELLCQDVILLFAADYSNGLISLETSDRAHAEAALAFIAPQFMMPLALFDVCLSDQDVITFLSAILTGENPAAWQLRKAYGAVTTPQAANQ